MLFDERITAADVHDVLMVFADAPSTELTLPADGMSLVEMLAAIPSVAPTSPMAAAPAVAMRAVAMRAPHRPNPICITEAKLLRREGARLVVTGLDAIDGTPVLDLKAARAEFDGWTTLPTRVE